MLPSLRSLVKELARTPASAAARGLLVPAVPAARTRVSRSLSSSCFSSTSSSSTSAFSAATLSSLSPRATPPAVYSSPVRSMGILSSFTDTVRNKVADAQADRQNEAFMHLRTTMLASPSFTFAVYYQFLKKSIVELDSWKGKVATKLDESQVADLKMQWKVIEQLTPLEMLNKQSAALNHVVKTRISQATQLSVPTINQELRKFDELHRLHGWLHRRVKQGAPLPSSQNEMIMMMAMDRPATPDDVPRRFRR